MFRVKPVLRNLCPNCGGPIEAERLEKGLPCARCLPRDPANADSKSIGEALLAEGTLLNYAWVFDLELELSEFKEYFTRKTGSRLWSAQESWAKRLLLLDSLAIIAPTGVGKTTLLSVYASFRAEKNKWKILYLVPTQNLVRQTAERISKILGEEKVAFYVGTLSKKKREELLARVREGKFSILVVTTSFLQRRFELLRANAPFNLVIVDDVDSLLKSGSNVDRVLLLMGFSGKTIENADKLVRAKLKLYAALAAGKEDRIRQLESEIAELEAEIRKSAPANIAQLVIASATGRPRGIRHLLFKELLGFEVGGGSDYMRSVTDTFVVSEDLVRSVVDIVKRVGRGGIIFVSQLYGKTAAKLLVEKLRREGVRAELALAGSRRSVSKLASGEADVIVGMASRYGVIVRGLDLPEVIRYAVFVEIPARRMRLEDAVSSPKRLLALLFYASDNGYAEAGEYAKRISKLLERLPDTRVVSAAFKGKISVGEGLLAELIGLMREAFSIIVKWLEEKLLPGDRLRLGGILVERVGSDFAVIVPDAPTYLQASGRTSRLYHGVMTHGLSIVVTSSKDYVEALEERLRWFADTRFVDFREVELSNILKKLEDSRRGKGKKVNVKTVLFIVESPTKAKTIAWFWGRPTKRRIGRLIVYETSTADSETGTVYLLSVTATRGHLLDIATDEEDSIHGVRIDGDAYKPVYTSIKRCLKCGYTFSSEGVCPRCGSRAVYSSQATIEALRKLALEVDEIIVATDPDREGEKIAWDVSLSLKPYNKNIRRGRFHEVTRSAILSALRNGEDLDLKLVYSQIVRRIEDRWIGFTLSQHLWAVYGKQWLGAGRVQTPVLGWVIERYRVWRENKGYYIIYSVDESNEKIIFFVRDPDEARSAPKKARIRLENAIVWDEETTPPPPYTTDSLLFDANRILGFNASFTMKLAQELFESGLITYHRTDSTRVSPTGIGIARAYLEKKGLLKHYQGRSWGEGGAHEAIRPTRPLDAEEVRRLVYEGTMRVPIKLTWAHLRLYDLIFKRFIASQMKPSRIKRVQGTLHLEGESINMARDVEGAIGYEQHGYALINPPYVRKWLLDLASGAQMSVSFVKRIRGSSVKLYTTGDLVRLMKEKRIGRPSTYAKVIESNRRHGYIILSKKKQYAIPTKLGIEVYEYLIDKFPELISEETSRELEEILDKIENGELYPCEALDRIATMIGSLLPESGLRSLVGEAAG